MTYSIPEVNIEGLEKKLTRIKNKCAKYGCEFRYERTGEHFEERTFSEYDYDAVDSFGTPATRKWTEIVKFIDIEVEGKALVDGWAYAASLEYTEAGNIISGIAGVEIPERYYNCQPWCEHCKTKRDRAKSFIVYKGSEFKQVGKSCLKDFTGGFSAEEAAMFESFFKDCEEATQFPSMGGCGSKYFYVEDFMVTLAETIRLYGYCKNDGYNLSTADRATEIYKSTYGLKIGNVAQKRVDEAKEKGFDMKNAESVELARKVREWVLSNERDDNYYHNLKVACSVKEGDYKVVGLLASSFPTYNRELEYEAERRAKAAKEAEERARSTWLGEVGEKVSFEITECCTITSWDTQWGTTYVYKFVNKDGLQATWKTSNWVNTDKVVGKTIKGTIKEQKEYRGIKQTELTRCKIA